MRKTKEQVLKDRIVAAIQGQDFQTAETLAQELAELEKAMKTPKTNSKARKAAATKAKKVPQKPKISKNKVKATPAPTEPIVDYIAPSRTERQKPRTFVGEDGREHTVSRRESMAGRKFQNLFKTDEFDVKLSPKHAKVDSKLRKAKIAPRPGQSGASRPAAEKLDVFCGSCGTHFKVYPWECQRVDAKSKYVCNDCIH